MPMAAHGAPVPEDFEQKNLGPLFGPPVGVAVEFIQQN
jgi:hypothetical protein